MFQAFQWKHLDKLPLMDGFAGVAVLVDKAVGRPGEVVLHLVGRELRQRADAHPDFVEGIETLRKMMSRDRDEPWRQAALRHKDLARFCACCDRLDDPR